MPESTTHTVTVTIPGAVHRLLGFESNWPKDCPTGWTAVEAGTRRNRGRGYQVVAELTVQDALDLADYLDSVADIREDISGPNSDPRPPRRAAAAILAAVAALPPADVAPSPDRPLPILQGLMDEMLRGGR